MFTLFAERSSATIVIDSIKTTISTCANNGGITVFAHSDNPLILYSITNGPVKEPVQTENIFSSLPAGTYTITVSDGASESITQQATIGGNYIPLDFNPIPVSPYCVGGSDGQIIGNITPGTGAAPYTWQLVSPSPVITSPQQSDTLNNLPAGNYSVRLTDACGNYETVAAIINNPNPQADFYFRGIEIVGCDSAWITYSLQYNPASLRLPLTYKFQTNNGTYIPTPGSMIVDSSDMRSSGLINIQQLIPGVTYYDSVRSIIYNSCGDSTVYTILVPPYTFYPLYSFSDCGAKINAVFKYNTSLFGLKAPVTYSLINTTTNAVSDSGTLHGDPAHYYGNMISSIPIAPYLQPGATYVLTVTDGCGKVFNQSFDVPSQIVPTVTGDRSYSVSCLDSASGLLNVYASGMGSAAKLVILSGPASLQSTKPRYAYSDNYVYPDTLVVSGTQETYVNGLQVTEDVFGLQHLALGTYQVEAIDTCYEAEGTITVEPSDITILNDSFYYARGCIGQNKLYYSLSAFAFVTVRNILTNTVISNKQHFSIGETTDSILNVPAGTYELTINYQQSYNGTAINENDNCWTIKDTVTIPPYQAPAITTSNYITCSGGANVELVPDSSKGVLPYEYTITGGPQTFPVQTSNIFPVTQTGIYQVSIADACGNASAAQVTVNGTGFPQVNTAKTTCNTAKLFGDSSIYFAYKWTTPKGNIYGDTITIDPVTTADTGNYILQRITNINGCSDTSYTSYHLLLPGVYPQTFNVCNNTTVQVGSHIYNTPGVYNDTLISSTGCDSIIITTITSSCNISPTISSFSPTAATADTVIIIGSHFTGTTTVSFGGTSAASFIVINDSTIKAVIGAGASGNVIVTTPHGTATAGGFVFTNTSVSNINVVVNNPTCTKDNGSISVFPQQGKPPYVFSLNGNIQNNGYFSNLDSGTYSLVITDSNGIQTDTVITLINSTYLPQASMQALVYPSGCTGSNGSLVISATGGSAPYMYSIDDYNFQSNDTFKNVSAGYYSFIVTDGNGCKSLLVGSVLGRTGCYMPIAGSYGSGCGNVGDIYALPEGTDSTYLYSSDGINYSSSPVFGLLAPGVHDIYYKNTVSGTVTIVAFGIGSECNPVLYANTVTASCGNKNGTINIYNVVEGTPPYLYTIDGVNFQSDSVFLGLAPGNYNIGVKNANGEIASSVISVPGGCVPHVIAVTITDTCGKGNGSIIASGSDGFKPYQYSIDGIHFQTDSLFSGLPANSYTVYFKDAHNGEDSTVAVVDNICLQVTAVSTNENCGNKNGSITATGSGGTQPYFYSIDNINFQSSNIFTGLDSGIYKITIKDAGALIDTTNITVINIPASTISLGSDTLLCSGQVLTLLAHIPGNNVLYSWQDGSTNNTYLVSQAGKYWVTAIANGCTSTDTIQVGFDPAPVVNLGNDTTLCDGVSKLLDATNNNATYQWQDGSSNPTYLVEDAGLYSVTVNINECKASDSIRINYIPKPVFNLSKDTFICKGQDIILAPLLNTSVAYLWQDGSTEPSFDAKDSGTYILTVTNDCGSYTDSIAIYNGACELYMPSAFTPNQDGLNDIFGVKYPFAVKQFNMVIYNRWGAKIFEANNMNDGWDGTFEGKPQPVGNYVWLISYIDTDGNNKSAKGNVILIR
jgi:gliding motility-associated-like protein